MTRTHYDLTGDRVGDVLSNKETANNKGYRLSMGRKLAAIAFTLTSLTTGFAAISSPAKAFAETGTSSSATAEQHGNAFSGNGTANVNSSDMTNTGSNAGNVNGSSTNAYDSVDGGSKRPQIINPGNTVTSTDDNNHNGSTRDDASKGNYTKSTNDGTNGSGSNETTTYSNTQYNNNKQVKSDVDSIQSKNYKPTTPVVPTKPTTPATPVTPATPATPKTTSVTTASSSFQLNATAEAMPITGGKGTLAETGGNVALASGGLLAAGIAAYLASRKRRANKLNQISQSHGVLGNEKEQEVVSPKMDVVPAAENEATREFAPNALMGALASAALSDEFVKRQLDLGNKIGKAA